MSIATWPPLATDAAPRPVRRAPARGGWRAAALMLGLAALPLLVTALLFVLPWQPPGQPRGELVPPTHPALRLAPVAGSDPPSAADAPHWLLVQTAPAACGRDCALALADLGRRIHVALYKQMPRVKRVWLLPPDDSGLGAALTARFPDLVVGHDRAFLTASGNAGIYLVDPRGRPVVRFDADANPRDVLHDLNRLLRTSWLG